MASAHSGSGLGIIGTASLPICLQMETVSPSSTRPTATMPVAGPLCPAADLCLCPVSPIGGLRGVGGVRHSFCHCLQPQLLACQASEGPLLPQGRGDRLQSRPWQEGCWACSHGQIWLLPGHGVRKWWGQAPSHVLSWLSALGGVTSGNWESASGFSPWDSWPLGCGVSQALLAISPTAVHTQGRQGQGRGPAGSSREPCPVTGSDLSSDLGGEVWVLGVPCQILAM